jgi:hypothetical protein
MPFEWNKEVYFVQSIYPANIVKVVDVYMGVAFNKSFEIPMAKTIPISKLCDEQGMKRGKCVISDSVNDSEIPWDRGYGWPLRGGTPGLLVKGVYLFFFHTTAYHFNHEKNGLARIYYFGAMTLCAQFPFHIHKMSRYPITHDPSMYDEKNIISKSKRVYDFYLDYVYFPLGIFHDYDKQTKVINDDYVWMSMGVAEVDGLLVKYDVAKLYESMSLVKEC